MRAGESGPRVVFFEGRSLRGFDAAVMPGWKSIRTGSIVGLLVILVGVWLAWSGIYKPLILGLGLLSCLLCVVVAVRIGFFDRGVFSLQVITKLPAYWAWLIPEIIKSSFEVARLIIDPKLSISPTIVEFDALPPGPIGQAILGNSITLTPGTVTMDVHDGALQVHCLTRQGAEDIKAGEFNRRAADLTQD